MPPVQNENLQDAWNNLTIQSLRRRHINKDLEGTLCKSCILRKKHDYSPLKSDLKSKRKEQKTVDKDSEKMSRRLENIPE